MYVTDATFAVAKRKHKNKIQAYKGLIEQPAQLVRVLHWYCRGPGFESRTGLNFFEICRLLTLDEHLVNPTVISLNLYRFCEFQKLSGYYLPCTYDLKFYPSKFGKVRRDVGCEYP